jgi:hypothetical protein
MASSSFPPRWRQALAARAPPARSSRRTGPPPRHRPCGPTLRNSCLARQTLRFRRLPTIDARPARVGVLIALMSVGADNNQDPAGASFCAASPAPYLLVLDGGIFPGCPRDCPAGAFFGFQPKRLSDPQRARGRPARRCRAPAGPQAVRAPSTRGLSAGASRKPTRGRAPRARFRRRPGSSVRASELLRRFPMTRSCARCFLEMEDVDCR